MTREEAINVVKNNWPDSSYTRLREALETLIPELKESEDERIRKAIRYAIGQSTHFDGTLINGVSSEEALAWLEKQGEKKPIGLEYAAKMFLEELSNTPYNNKPITDAQVITKELLNFFQNPASYNPDALNIQQPAEWSEEDESMREALIQDFEMLKDGASSDTVKALYDKRIAWLKSLKPQPHWKPSEKQMEALRVASEVGTANESWAMEKLKTLYSDLQKL